MDRQTTSMFLSDEGATAALAKRLASTAKVGDTFCLNGDIGAGKSTLSRAFIRARLDNPYEDVPSPTFTLVQTYNDPDGDIWHCDLYRLNDPDEAVELGLDEAFETAICLIEWPDRLGSFLPKNAIDVVMKAGSDGHHLTLTAPKAIFDRLGLSLG